MEKEYFYFQDQLPVLADSKLNNETMRQLWRGFCANAADLRWEPGQENTLRTAGMEIPSVPAGKEFAIRVTPEGLAMAGRDYGGLARGLMVLMQRIEPVDLEPGKEAFRIKTCCLESQYTIEKRMIHICVFPETTALFLEKTLRLAGVMQYTHVVLEYWGTLQYDCLKELAWPQAFDKAFAKDVARQIREMGMEAIPMMNHLGHASACRVSGGKHVALDQNPRLATLFSPDGWSWNIESEKAKELLSAVRRELYDIYPDAKYIHLGCDEVYSYERGEEDQRKMRAYLTELLARVKSEGKTPMIWGDMLLNAENVGVVGDKEHYYCSGTDPQNTQKLIDAIPRDTVIVDWHYKNLTAPVKTSLYLKANGFRVIGAPWHNEANCQAHVDTIRDYDLEGLMVTTWHTMAEKMPRIVTCALMCGAYQSPWSGPQRNKVNTETATLLRKVCFVQGDYRESGWNESQLFLQAHPMD